MSEITRKEQEWTDREGEEEQEQEPYERTYRDGSAVHECWSGDDDTP